MEKIPVSFGCMCSTAIFLKDKGYRDRSSFFDWIDSNLIDNIRLVDCDFRFILDKRFLIQKYKDCPHIVSNELYNLSFVHLFDSKKEFDRQIQEIKNKVFKQINNFLSALNSGKCLLVYYLRREDEISEIEKRKTLVKSFLEKHSAELIIVSNFKKKISFLKTFYIPYNNVHIPFGGNVSFPFSMTEDIESYLNMFVNPSEKERNLNFYKKQKRRLAINIKRKIKNFIYRYKHVRLVIKHEKNDENQHRN